jgi:5-methylcytosine-specific restriction enzyme A
MNTDCLKIKKKLEEVYDIPFVVESGVEYSDPWYRISPDNDMEEFFDVNISFRQRIRMIIEVSPQKYSQRMLQDMQNAGMEKKKTFFHYVKLLKDKGAKTEMHINQSSFVPNEENVWPDQWKQFKIRATKSPITSDFEDFNAVLIAMEWATMVVGMVLSLLHIEQLEDEKIPYSEGKIGQALINRYERNPVNRELCLAANGYVCKICEFNFEKIYGELGYEFIHVHHIIPVSSMGGEYYLNPEKDLIPVCPNCHAMLHRVDPPYLPDELKKIIEIQKVEDISMS